MEMFRTAVCPAALSLCAFLTASLFSSVAVGQDDQTQFTSAAGATNYTITQSVERMQMLVKSSSILTLDAKIPRFQVHNEEVLGATPISQNQLQVFAKTPGTTQINLWDTDEKQYTVDITVIADAREIEGILSSQLPMASLKVMPTNASAIVSGFVTSADDVDVAIAIVEQYYATVVNHIRVVGVQQVLLHTKIMEVSRTKFRQLGIDFAWTDGSKVISSSIGGFTPNSVTNVFSGDEFEFLVQALRNDGLVKFLAEPTVVATHGRPARFNSGGSIPFQVSNGASGNSISFQEYGTSVDFLPFIVGPGRIRLEVRPEVKEIDSTFSQGGIPGFVQRYVDTSVELQAGQTFAIAGLLQTRVENGSSKTPLLGEIPLLGAFFRNTTARRNDVELLITITPELVDALDPHQVPCGGVGPNSMEPNDHDLYLNGHIEVPNLRGGDGCSMESGPGMGGPSMIQTNVMQYGGPGMHRGSGYPAGAAMQSAPMIAPGAVVPNGSSAPVIGDEIMLPTPSAN